MSLSRRDLLSASALLLAGPGAVLRAAAGETAASGGGPIVLSWNENPYGPSPAARARRYRSYASTLVSYLRRPRPSFSRRLLTMPREISS